MPAYDDVVQNFPEYNSQLEEDNDPNDDVSFGYLLTGSDERLFLQLSMVGRYAVVQRGLTDGSTELLSPTSLSNTPFSNRIAEILEKVGIQVLDQDTLSYPVPLVLFNTETSNLYFP
jgi:hypothetical protein